MSPFVELPELDPFVEDFQQFPFATLALLRERAPVHAIAEPGWYIVTTIELAREVLTDPARFSNQVSRRTSPPAEVADEVAAIRSQGFRVCVAVRSVTSTGSPPRIRSRARKDCPGAMSLTSCRL